MRALYYVLLCRQKQGPCFPFYKVEPSCGSSIGSVHVSVKFAYDQFTLPPSLYAEWWTTVGRAEGSADAEIEVITSFGRNRAEVGGFP